MLLTSSTPVCVSEMARTGTLALQCVCCAPQSPPARSLVTAKSLLEGFKVASFHQELAPVMTSSHQSGTLPSLGHAVPIVTEPAVSAIPVPSHAVVHIQAQPLLPSPSQHTPAVFTFHGVCVYILAHQCCTGALYLDVL